jgi:hypothetical protein
VTEAERRRNGLLTQLDAARDAFLAALDEVEPELVTTPGLVGEWSARDLLVHVAFWSQHGADALALAEAGRGDEFTYDQADTDAMNARVAEEARGVDVTDAMRREAAAFAAFRGRLLQVGPGLLDLRLGNDDRVEEVVRYDGPDHYAEHTRDLRAWWAEGEEGVDEVDEIEMIGADGETG